MKKILLLAIALFGLSTGLYAQKITLGTNVVQWANLGTINLEGTFAVAQHVSLTLGGRYNPWYFERETENQFQNRKRGAWFGVRYWPWYVNSGWFFAAKGQWQEYNYYLPGQTEVKEEGDRFGGGLIAGHAFMLTKHLNLEVGLGAWCGVSIYNEDLLPEKGRRITSGARKFFFLPDDVSVSLVYVF